MITLKQVSKKNKKKVDSFKIKEWKKHDKENNYVYKEKKFRFAAYNGEDVIGNAYGNTNGGVAYLDGLIVSKKYRNRGIGKMLLKKFEETAKKRKCHLAYLKTSEKHIEALNFYKKNGYKTIATLPNNKFGFTWYYLGKEIR